MQRPIDRSGRTILLHFVLFFAGFLLLGIAEGCREETKPKEEKQTLVSLENLQTAHTVAAKRARMYELFIPRAEKERFRGVAALYKALYRAETVHAAAHASLMRRYSIEPAPVRYDSTVVGSTMQTLKMAISSEEIELTSMYPNLLRTATAENFADGVRQFEMCQSVEDRHVELLKDAQNKMGKIDAKFWVCPGCGYIITSEATEECPVCRNSRSKFEKI